jgi:hypothetical protein
MKLTALLLSPVVFLLAGCPAGVAPIVAYPTGSMTKEPQLIASLPATSAHAEIRLYSQEIEHNYKVLVSPDGGRDNHPLKSSYRYYVKIGNTGLNELEFLRSNPGMTSRPAEYFKKISPVGGQEAWVGYGLCSGESEFDPSGWFPESPEQKAEGEKRTSRYFISVFSPTALLARVEVISMTRRPGIEYLPEAKAVRFRGPNGWMRFEVESHQIVKEPGQSSELRPLTRQGSS